MKRGQWSSIKPCHRRTRGQATTSVFILSCTVREGAGGWEEQEREEWDDGSGRMRTCLERDERSSFDSRDSFAAVKGFFSAERVSESGRRNINDGILF